MDIGLALQREFLHPRAQGTRRVFAHDLERNPLRQVAERAPVDEQTLFGMRQHVDEPGRRGFRLCVDLDAAGARRMLADVADAIAVDRNIAEKGASAGSIEDERAPNDRVVILHAKLRRNAVSSGALCSAALRTAALCTAALCSAALGSAALGSAAW